MSTLFDTERYAEYQELLTDFGVVIGGGETIGELISLIEEHIGEISIKWKAQFFPVRISSKSGNGEQT